MASNPLPPNFGANLANQIRESLAAGFGGFPTGGNERRNNGNGGHHRRSSPSAPAKRTLTPEEQARQARGALNLIRHETQETRHMTDEQLQRLVLLQKLKLQNVKLEQHQVPITISGNGEERDGLQPGHSRDAPGGQTLQQRTAATKRMREESNKTMCKICFANDVEFALECGHLLCGTCIQNLDTCSNCRIPISNMTKIFW